MTMRMPRQRGRLLRVAAAIGFGLAVAASCSSSPPPADLVITNANVYTLGWPEPSTDGRPAPSAPFDSARGWHPDAQAIAVRGGKVVFVGPNDGAKAYTGSKTRTLDAAGATVIPGLIDAHVHLANLGESLERVKLTGVATEAEAVELVVKRAATVPKGEWIVGYGWDEGAWANHYPDMKLLTARVPDHPVYMRSLHSFAAWGNTLAFERARITRTTRAPDGGEIRKDAAGNPTGLLLNRAVALLDSAIPPPNADAMDRRLEAALHAMAEAGYTMVHDANTDSATLGALQRLNSGNKLPLRVYVMMAERDPALLRRWLALGPDTANTAMLRVRGVKAFDDGALGSRGARLLADYADRPGQRGVVGANAGFNQPLVDSMMRAGFQVAVHAIGDQGNRETLDFFERVFTATPNARTGRHRIEHAQVLSAQDIPRFAKLGVIASMQPSHAVEDMAWAEQRLGPERVRGAYAWRTLRIAGARLVFSSDLPGPDNDIFYGLHSAVTRRDRSGQPPGGWYPNERMTPEEAVRGFTTWAAYASFVENDVGMISVGRRADLTLLSIDPFAVGTRSPDSLLTGRVRGTLVAGRMIYGGVHRD